MSIQGVKGHERAPALMLWPLQGAGERVRVGDEDRASFFIISAPDREALRAITIASPPRVRRTPPYMLFCEGYYRECVSCATIWRIYWCLVRSIFYGVYIFSTATEVT